MQFAGLQVADPAYALNRHNQAVSGQFWCYFWFGTPHALTQDALQSSIINQLAGTMLVQKKYYLGILGAFITDVKNAHNEADVANDRDGQRTILSHWLEYFDQKLGNMSAGKLVDYLNSRQVWRRFEDRTVFKTVGEPCISYTAQTSPAGDVTLIALGACYRYPAGSEERWWSSVILPRLRSL